MCPNYHNKFQACSREWQFEKQCLFVTFVIQQQQNLRLPNGKGRHVICTYVSTKATPLVPGCVLFMMEEMEERNHPKQVLDNPVWMTYAAQ